MDGTMDKGARIVCSPHIGICTGHMWEIFDVVPRN
jgi:hypothetical protein